VQRQKRELAEPLLRRALRTEENTLGPEHLQLTSTLTDLALLYTEEKKFAMAEPLLKRALTIEENALGVNHPNLAATLNRLSLVYIKDGRYSHAEPLLTRAVALTSGNPAFAHEHVNGLRWLGLAYDREGKAAESESAYKHALDLWIAASPRKIQTCCRYSAITCQWSGETATRNCAIWKIASGR